MIVGVADRCTGLVRHSNKHGLAPVCRLMTAMGHVGLEVLTGDAAGKWTKFLNKRVNYAPDDLAAFEQRFRVFALGWSMTYWVMMDPPLRSYNDFAVETAIQRQGS